MIYKFSFLILEEDTKLYMYGSASERSGRGAMCKLQFNI